MNPLSPGVVQPPAGSPSITRRPWLDHWLEAAAPVRDFVGFAIGRSIWWEALSELLEGSIDEAAARKRIAASYLSYADAFLAARAAAGE